MKKNYFMLALATMMMAACAENDLINEMATEDAPQAIEFDAFANKTTRAEITEPSHLQAPSGGFHVWGYKTRGSEAEYTVLYNEPVSWDESKWDYENTQYWDETATYQFYAAAPKAPTNVTYSIGGNKMITIKGATSGLSTSVTDYLIDRNGIASTQGKTGLESFTDGVVSFSFNHIMAKLSFKFRASVAETIKITSLTMSGWNSGAGTFTQTSTSTSTTVANDEWSISAAAAGVCTIIDGNNPCTTTNTAAEGGGYSFIMVPQTITYVAPIPATEAAAAVAEAGLTFTISYYIINGFDDSAANRPTDDPVDEFFKDQVGILKATQVWGTDAHTTYTIVVGPDAIEFGTPTVNTWSVTDNKREESLTL